MKTTFIEKQLHDEPVGNWYLCTNCDEIVFLPDGLENINFCVCCGAEIVVFQKDNEE
jgi:rRNA maturation endonuclease Nob1